MKVLGISSAIEVVGAAVAEENKILSECTVSGKIIRSEKIIVLINEALNRTKLKITDIDAIAVTTGPGSYSGLRGGLATAKGLVAALNIPLISVSTLHAIAYNFIDHTGTVAVAVNACKDDYNFSLWGASKGAIKRLTGDITVKSMRISEVLMGVKGAMILATDENIMKMIKNENILFADPKNVIPWASNVARIGIEKSINKEFGDYITAVPSYSHKPNIREFRK